MSSKYRGRSSIDVLKPAIFGLLLSFALTMLLIAIFSLLFVIIKQIAESALVPIALICSAAGCFAGAFICAAQAREGAVIYGIAIGLTMFVAIWIIGAFCENSIFGTETIIKFVLLIASGFAGGYLGKNRRFMRK